MPSGTFLLRQPWAKNDTNVSLCNCKSARSNSSGRLLDGTGTAEGAAGEKPPGFSANSQSWANTALYNPGRNYPRNKPPQPGRARFGPRKTNQCAEPFKWSGTPPAASSQQSSALSKPRDLATFLCPTLHGGGADRELGSNSTTNSTAQRSRG